MKRYKVLSNSKYKNIDEMTSMVGGVYKFVRESWSCKGELCLFNPKTNSTWTFPPEDLELVEYSVSPVEPEKEEPSQEDIAAYVAMARDVMAEHPNGYGPVHSTAHAIEFLDRAKQLFIERGKDYDQEEERSMGKTVRAFNAITGKDLTEPEGWLLFQILKDVRQWTSPTFHRDSAEDCISYAALKAESLAKDKK